MSRHRANASDHINWLVQRARVAFPYVMALMLLDGLIVLIYNYVVEQDLLIRATVVHGVELLAVSLLSIMSIAFSRNRNLPVTFAFQVSLCLFLAYMIAITFSRSSYSITLTTLACVTTCIIGSVLSVYLAKFLGDNLAWIGGPRDADRRAAIGPGIIDTADSNDLDERIDGLVVGHDNDRANSNLIAEAIARGVEVIAFPRYYEYRFGQVYLPDFNVDDLSHTHTQRTYIVLKRAIDILACITLAPFILLLCGFTALYILGVSGRPIFFRQSRVGLGGKPFQILKFRTMSEARPELSTTTTQINDDRIIKGGRFLRRFRLDEIPQFLHILSGKMSLIGPRPEWLVLVERYSLLIPEYNYRHLVRPGLSGWAQTKMGYASDIEETRRKISYDLYYVKYISLELDLRVLIKTLRVLFAGAGAR